MNLKFLLVDLFNKINTRLNAFIRLNMIVIPSLMQHNNPIIRKFIIYRWIHLNIIYLNPIRAFIKSPITMIIRVYIYRVYPKVQNPSKVSFPDNTEIVFINLEHRKDRLASILKQLDKIEISRFKRFEAHKRDWGMEGCTLSHLAVLDEFNSDSNSLLMVLEDDAVFHAESEVIKMLIDAFLIDERLDILCLGFNENNRIIYNSIFDITTDTQTLSCYIVKPYMIDKLRKNFSLAYSLQVNRIDEQFGSAIDVVWKQLQGKYVFAIPKYHVVTQYASISDNGFIPKFVDYGT